MQRQLSPLQQLFKTCMQSIGGVLVIFKFMLIILLFYSFTFDICQIFFNYTQSELYTTLLLLSGTYLVFNITFNFVFCIFQSPGTTKGEKFNLPEQVLNEDQIVDIKERGGYNICKKCMKTKPQRAHHCTICNVCVLKMDHHCPWLNNCVGFNTQRYFLLNIFWLAVGTTWLTIWYTIILFNPEMYAFKKQLYSKTFGMAQILCLVLSMILALFSAWNWYLAVSGQTSIEFWGKRLPAVKKTKEDYEFNAGSYRENLYQVFGTKNIFLMLQPSIRPLPVNGFDWSNNTKDQYAYSKADQQDDIEKFL